MVVASAFAVTFVGFGSAYTFSAFVDSLQRDRFYELTRRDALARVLAGLEHLARFPEAHPIKVNAVAIRGFTEQEAIPFARFARESPEPGDEVAFEDVYA